MPATTFPPHSRGWTPALGDPTARMRVSPALAGMDLNGTFPITGALGFPRTRGDGPRILDGPSRAGRFPPHSRGWTRCTGTMGRRTMVSPALAGMDPQLRYRTSQTAGFPRTRGDGPKAGVSGEKRTEFPPHSRGWTPGSRARLTAAQVSPALAGMDPDAPGRGRAEHRFPRTRGDGPWKRPVCCIRTWFPPHSRGWTQAGQEGLGHAWVSPALAGMDPERLDATWLHSGFPRTRGDGPHQQGHPGRLREFPPHSRGWTSGRLRGSLRTNVSPALAGMDPKEGFMRVGATRFPRTRGDGPCLEAMRRQIPDVSPALAGMDLAPPGPSSERRCFPRTRGDGPTMIEEGARAYGFPPHSRGWTPRCRPLSSTLPVSPALAGMDLWQAVAQLPARGFHQG